MARSLCLLTSFCVLGFAAPAPADDPPADKDVRASVVKIEATLRAPNPGQPWNRLQAMEVGGSGLVIDGKRVLTNAHVVSYATQVTVQASTGSEKFPAKVEAIATGIDLAVLKVEDEAFFDGKPPFQLSTAMPKERDSVMVYGYPTGGSRISVTKGIVSRVEFTNYNQDTSGLRAQIDAAINPGNSGGPVVSDGKLMGVAFSRLGGAQGIGYVIPAEEVRLFLEDVKDGKYDGKPALFDQLQTLENPALRKMLKVPSGASGIVVHKAEPPGIGGESPLKEWDLITHIGEHAVDNTGLAQVAEGLDLRFQYYVQSLTKDGKVPLTVLRDGQLLKLDVPVASRRPMVMPALRGGTPSYFIFGPIAFTAASSDLLLSPEAGQRGLFALLLGMKSPLGARFSDRPNFEGEQIVAVPCAMFPHRLVKGYSDIRLQTIRSVNNVPIKNLRHLVETIRDCKDDLLVIAFNEENCETIVIDRKAAQDASEEILSDNGIRKQCSDDLKSVWEKN